MALNRTRRPFTVLVTGTPSDSHTWNLVYLELVVRERGHEVVNLGACVPVPELVRRCLETAPDLVVVSSVNGHGHQDGLRVARALRARPELADVPVVIGGKLGVTGGPDDRRVAELTASGFTAVFDEDGEPAFLALLRRLSEMEPATV